jgi:hypothetical protein
VGKTNAEESKKLARESTDCSFLLTHLIRQNDDKTEADAQNILDLILDIHNSKPNPLLKSSRTGWYSSASAKYFSAETCQLKNAGAYNSVCFTESTLSGLKAHRDMFRAKYGLSFNRDFLLSKGAAPCINIPQNIFKKEVIYKNDSYPRKVFNFIPQELHPYINVMSESFDASHEREWRHHYDMEFSWSDIRFIFCPESDFETFSKIQINGLPTLFDLTWLDRV